MFISDLYDKHEGEDIYVVGTGPSMQYFPVEMLEGRITIGLNQAYRFAPMTYSITCHPELVLEYKKLPESERNPTQWCIKAWKAPMNLTPKHPAYYVFQSGDPKHGHNLDFIHTRAKNSLYQGRGIQQTAMNLACHMKAKVIFLVGIDMCSLEGDHHGLKQHTRFCGLNPEDVYYEYRLFTNHARKAIWDSHKIPVITLSPFIGLKNVEEDAERLRKQRRIDKLPEAKDISTRNRRKIDRPKMG